MMTGRSLYDGLSPPPSVTLGKALPLGGSAPLWYERHSERRAERTSHEDGCESTWERFTEVQSDLVLQLLSISRWL